MNKYFADHSAFLSPNVSLKYDEAYVLGGAMVWPLPEVKLYHRPLLFCLQENTKKNYIHDNWLMIQFGWILYA